MPPEFLKSRDRVLRTLKRQPVDRFPLDLGSHMSTGISAFAYWNLREALGLPNDKIQLPDTVQMLAYVDEDVRQRFHIDCILLEPSWPNPARWNPRGKYNFITPAGFKPQMNSFGEWIVWQNGQFMRMPADGFFFDGAWLSSWSEEDQDSSLNRYAREAEHIFKETDYATNFVGYSYGCGFGAFFDGIEHAVEMLESPNQVINQNELRLADSLRRAGKIIDKFGKYIQLITISADMGTQDRPMCRPSLIEQFSAPYIHKFCEFIHRNSDIKVFMHNCGSIQPLIPILIEAGVDVLNPVQISAGNMDPAQLKAKFGDRLVFWGGGCDTQNVLARGTPAQVEENVTRLCDIFKQGGGFTFNQVHNIMGDIPPENIIAMLDAAYQASFYKSSDFI